MAASASAGGGSSRADVVRVGCVASGQVRGSGKSRIPDPESDLIAGPFAIRALKDPYWTDRPELFERKPGQRYAGLKDGALLKAGNTVTVTVPKSERPHVKLDYGISKPSAFAVRFKACPRRHNPRTGFPGGFLVDGPRCSRLRIRVHGSGGPPLHRPLNLSPDPCPDTRSTSTAGSEEGAPPVVDCESRLKVGNPDSVDLRVRRNDLLAGPVLFVGAKYWRKHRRKLFKPRRRGGLRPAKVPMVVRADHEVTVTVLPPEGHRARLTVGRDQAPYSARGTSVTLRSCPAEAAVPGGPFAPWTTFLAGFKVDAPICVGIEVAVAGAPAPITKSIAFGRRTRRTCPV
jgi:hypothetical protein